jgi:hypothetical protein
VPTAFERSPEELHSLRLSVAEWLGKASRAVSTFRNPRDQSFWLHSKRASDTEAEPYHPSLTTTARCYAALAAAHRCFDECATIPSWAQYFGAFTTDLRLRWAYDGYIVYAPETPKPLNNFDVAHLADLVLVGDYLNRYWNQATSIFVNAGNGWPRRPLREAVDRYGYWVLHRKIGRIKKDSDTWRQNGCLAFEDVRRFRPLRDEEKWAGHHLFVTLHWLRACAIANPKEPFPEAPAWSSANFGALIGSVQKFCKEQCFHKQIEASLQYDATSLTFGAVIYSLYSDDVDPGLLKVVVDAIAAAQRDHGSWPATHPIFRGGTRPWHITSHEIALSLTWLYFQPRVPDSVRATLLQMMETYFRNWVIPTFVGVKKTPAEARLSGSAYFRGWYDDHTTARDFVVGWATAIVCQFLANYYWVLEDHINRRVIESLELQSASARYLIDATAHGRAQKWSKRVDKFDKRSARYPTWFDVPPYAWPESTTEPAATARELCWLWTDPSTLKAGTDQPRTALALSTLVLNPVFDDPAGRPAKRARSAILSGKPGTRKTSLVDAVAELLEWPRVSVLASVIFDKGFDLMEAQASDVFRRLSYLRRCVVFFDEFEEFVRDRGEDIKEPKTPQAIGYRTIAAFTTSAMLPRFQEFHDQSDCLLFLATNYLEKVDRAVRRLGRFDFELVIDHPVRETLLRLLEQPTRRTLKNLDLAIDDRGYRPRNRGEYRRMSRHVRDAVEDFLGEDTVMHVGAVDRALAAVLAAQKAGVVDADHLRNAAKEALKASAKQQDENAALPKLEDLQST